jgi:hypothetical protein
MQGTMTPNVVPLRSNQQLTAIPAVTLGLSPVRRMSMPNGDRGTAFTIAKIRELVHQGMTDQAINRLAFQIVHAAGVREFDFAGEAQAIYAWVRRNIRFFRDIEGVETLRTAREILTIGGGDCDDINAVLMPSLLGTIGHSVRLVTVSSDPAAPATFTHIYCEVEMNGQWVPLDAARRDPAFGKGPRSYFRKRVWSLTDNDFQDVAGLSSVSPCGLGAYYGAAATRTRGGQVRRQMRRMGDFTDILDSLAPVIQSAGTATAQIINATSGGIRPSIPGYAVNPATGQLVPINPTGQLTLATTPGGLVGVGGGSIPNWMLYGGLGLLGLLAFKAVAK